MISHRMTRPAKVILTLGASLAIGAATGACGTQWISVPKSNAALYHGAVLFNQRCAGCHTLSFAGTHGSAQFVRTKEFNNGPNFNIRCERPVTRVLYAIENGGFSGQIMPQNIVVGQDAIDVAKFVATYAGRGAPFVPGIVPCTKLAVGTIPAFAASVPATTATTSTTSASGTSTSPYSASPPARRKAKRRARPTSRHRAHKHS
jgi:mono/diheme cytochrome c family protein